MTRAGYVWITSLSALAIAGVSLADVAPRLVWNASASVPLGLYLLRSPEPLGLGDLVAVEPPEPLARFLAERGYIADGVPLLKHVIALPGRQVCRHGRAVTVDGQPVGEARERDRMGRDLPVWQGCRIIGEGEIFLMNPSVEDSLDGRYFGPTPRTSVIGQAIPIWTEPDPGSRGAARAAAP
ncbi:S26 family signal peptidase [Plastorhodobacter daqingensis]|uniref:S26 family signal peptidase n=1 Tax=Plastorhodobacter daqingensis TaxID=1387281 RepID=A0ABW2UQU7_9RHOB